MFEKLSKKSSTLTKAMKNLTSLFVLFSCLNVSAQLKCPEFDHWVKPHNRSAYTRSNGTIVSAMLMLGCTSPSLNEDQILDKLDKLKTLKLGVSTGSEAKVLLGSPEIEKIQKFVDGTKTLYWGYGIVYSGKSKIPVPSFQILLDPDTKIVQSYNLFPFKLKKFGMAEVKSHFPDANFKVLPIDYKKHHAIPTNRNYKDKQYGIGFEYDPDRDELLYLSVWKPNETKKNNSKN